MARDHTLRCETVGRLKSAATELTLAVKRCCKNGDRRGIAELRKQYKALYPKEHAYVDDLIRRAIATYAADPHSQNPHVKKVVQRYRRRYSGII